MSSVPTWMPPSAKPLATSMRIWVRSRACEFSYTTLRFSGSWPMSLKCCMTLSPMSMTRTVAPSCSDTMMALDFVRSVVPKHGMVTAVT